MTVKHWPARFVDMTSRTVIAEEWFRAASPNMWEEIVRRAEDIARIEGVEVDVMTGTVMPSGAVGSWDRAGVRARPA